jgi:SNF2 family DNA or RNA helicase
MKTEWKSKTILVEGVPHSMKSKEKSTENTLRNYHAEFETNLDEEVNSVELKLPKELLTRLFPHQRYGVKWLYNLHHHPPYGGLLAGKMNLRTYP